MHWSSLGNVLLARLTMPLTAADLMYRWKLRTLVFWWLAGCPRATARIPACAWWVGTTGDDHAHSHLLMRCSVLKYWSGHDLQVRPWRVGE